MYWKSLDHLGSSGRTADKKQFASKTLLTEIHLRYEEQRREPRVAGGVMPRYQLEFASVDLGIVLDASRLLIAFVANAPAFGATDRQRLENFVRGFVTTFFGISHESYDNTVRHIPSSQNQADDELPDAGASSGESSNQRSRGAQAGRKTDLLRGVLNRGRSGKGVNRDGESAAPSPSKETTPDVGSTMDEDAHHGAQEVKEDAEMGDVSAENWARPVLPAYDPLRGPVPREITANEPYERDSFNLYCGQSIYGFFRLFQLLYERLSQVKRQEATVVADVRLAKMAKPALDLDMVPKPPEDHFEDTGPDANFYGQVLDMMQDVMEQNMEMAQFEEVMRTYYLQTGWQLYGFDRLFSALARSVLQILTSDAKDKSYDMMQLFFKDREKVETTHEMELFYRRQVERMVKDGDVYRIEYVRPIRPTGALSPFPDLLARSLVHPT